AVNATNVAWTVNYAEPSGSILKMPKTGGTPTTLASGLFNPGGIQVDSSAVYWALEGGQVMGVPTSGGAVATLADWRADPNSLSAGSGNVFWIDAASGQ